MKVLAIILVALVGTLVMNGPIQSYADPQLDTLLMIATQAKNNLSINISQISIVPVNISHLFKQGSDETDALSKAVNQQNVTSARQHFLFAMKFFKETNDEINSLNATVSNDQQRADIIQLQSEIARMDKIGGTLRTIAITNRADINFTQFDQSIQKANQDLDVGNIDDASKAIDVANHFLVDVHHSLAEVAKQKSADRAKDFTVKQAERFNKIEETNASQNVIFAGPQNASLAKTNSTIIPGQMHKDMIAELKKLVSEGNVDEALKVIKQLESIQSVNPAINAPGNTTTATLTKNASVNVPASATNPPVNTTIHTSVKKEPKTSLNQTSATSKKGSQEIPQGSVHLGSDTVPKENNHEVHHKNHSQSGND